MFKRLRFTFLATILDLGSPIILLPFVIIYLNPTELGTWYLFSSLNLIVKFPESALNSSLMRNCSYFYSVFKYEVSSESNNKFTIALNEKIIYKKNNYLVLFLLVLYFVPCGIYLFIVTKNLTYYCFWILFSFSNIMLTIGSRHKISISVFGSIEKIYIPEVISKIIFLLSAIITLYFKLSLLGLVIASFFSSLAYFVLIRNANEFKKNQFKFEKDLSNNSITKYLFIIDANINKEFFKQLRIDGVNTIAARTSVLVVGASFSVNEVAVFGLTSNLFSIVHRLSILPFSFFTPLFAKLNGTWKTKLLKNLFYRILFFAIIFCLFSSISIITLGQFLLSLISKTAQLENKLTLTLFLFLTLSNVIYDSFITILISRKDFIFLKSTIISGIIVICFQIFLSKFMGINGLILVAMLIPFSYIYWRWPSYAVRKLKLI